MPAIGSPPEETPMFNGQRLHRASDAKSFIQDTISFVGMRAPE